MIEFLGDARAFLPVLLQGLVVTVELTLAALSLSLVLGMGWVALGRSAFAPARLFAVLVINTIRGIPIIVQLFFIYFVLPDWGLDLPPFLAGTIGLGLAYSVYQAENIRGGIGAVDKGLIEAGEALGMGRLTLWRRVILPLGLRHALPAMGNSMVMLLKDTSIASTITIAELTRAGQLLAISTFRNGSVYALLALLYLAASLPLAWIVRTLERRGRMA